MLGMNEIPWHKLEKFSFKLQKRIYRASQCNDIRKMHNLQRLLLKSTSAKMLAVRRITEGKRQQVLMESPILIKKKDCC